MMTIKQSTFLAKYYYALAATFFASVALETVLTSATSSMTSVLLNNSPSDVYNNNNLPSINGSNNMWMRSPQFHRRSIIANRLAPSCKDLAFVSSWSDFQHDNNHNTMQKVCQYHSENPTSTTKLNMSSPPSSSRQSYGNTRNRGANSANRNRRGHEFRLNKDGQRSRKKGNTKRPPRWEREGDKLYAEVTKQLDAYNKGDNDGEDDENACDNLLMLANEKIATAQDVHRLMEPWTATREQLQEMKERKEKVKARMEKAIEEEEASKSEEEEEENPKKENKGSPFLWGSLPLGPVLASRLRASERHEPTSVQRAAFRVLTAGLSKGSSKNTKDVRAKRSNAIIASPTGTGKTLSYLLPLLCTSPGGQSKEGTGGVLIVTPTIELACQIQREVDVLWPPLVENESSCFVVGVDDASEGGLGQDGETDENDVEDDDFTPPGRITLKSIGHAPLIAGTPKMLRTLYKEAERVVADGRQRDYRNIDPTISREERVTSKALVTNLRAVVLDEADRLLRTEAVARETTERKMRKIAMRKAEDAANAAKEQYIRPPPPAKKKRLVVARQTQTEFLLRDLPIYSLDDVQIICASATIGRTMRRQLMQILDAPSADAAATLVTGDTDERVKSKDAERRKSVLLPEELRHGYRVVVEDKNEEDLAEDNDGLPKELLSKVSTAENNEERRVKATISTLWDTMVSMEEAKPILIFPGRVGVERVQQEFLSLGLEDVRTLRNLDGKTPEAGIEIDAHSDMQQDDDHDWKSIPVYIIGERFARGLDLPDVEYVFMLSPPSSAAGYAHMAGRTGRNGNEGTAITLVKAKNNEVQRLAAIAEALGLKFDASVSGTAGGEIEQSCEAQDGGNINPPDGQEKHDTVAVLEASEESDASSYPWEHLSDSAISRKKNAELYEYLTSFGKGSETINKRSKKADLVEAIRGLHANR